MSSSYELMNNNVVVLSGQICQEPKYSHQMFGEGFYETFITVPRLSEQLDIIPITISERLLKDERMSKDFPVTITGQLRSYNKIIDEKSRLLLTVFVRDILDYDMERNPNSIDIVGYICKTPVYRTTPFKREICDILLAVNRAYNKSDYLPCIAWGRNARFVKDLSIGTKLIVNGRIQSRNYQKVNESGEVETKVAYEVSINRISMEEGFENNRQEQSQD
ncbi:MAG: single-stranded DNA-binding protein [Christensenellales bacterium]|jgi:primosomal replication protein N|nr:single-stranded DNA-binding protein [Clostridiales bacterium]